MEGRVIRTERTPVDGNVGLTVQVQLGIGRVECSQKACPETEFVQSHDHVYRIPDRVKTGRMIG
jgi:hypothetical protein